MITLARFLVVFALVAQGPVADLASTDDDPRPEPLSVVANVRADSAPPADARVRSEDNADDDESSELDESGIACLPAESTGSASHPLVVVTSSPIHGSLLASQVSPGASPSRAPPLL